MGVIKINNYNFVCTCECCPEQYDVYDENNTLVAYVRLRYGSLYAYCPCVSGVEVYYASTGRGDHCTGSFKNDHERKYHLAKIARAIDKYLEGVVE